MTPPSAADHGSGLARTFFDAVTTGTLAVAPQQLPDTEAGWQHLLLYLGGCGLARPLTTGLLHEQLRSVAPPGFMDNLNRRALADALRELSHRETLELLHAQLTSMGCRAILLKGAALSVLEEAHHLSPGRVPGDLDIWVETGSAARDLRQRLIRAGFAGQPDAPQTAPHHLAPVSWRESAVEIHTNPMPDFWGMPHASIAQRALPTAAHSPFYVLSPSDMILHEAVHSTSHLYSFGLKLPFDILRIQRLGDLQLMDPPGAGQPAQASAIDWGAVADRAHQLQCPLALWSPLMALHSSFGDALPIPSGFRAAAPRSKRALRCTRIARSRMFSAVDNADAMNPFVRNWLFLLLHDRADRRLCYLKALISAPAAESRKAALASGGGQSWKQLPRHLREAWKEISQYRR